MTEEQSGPVSPDHAEPPPEGVSASEADTPEDDVETLRAELAEARQQHLRALADYQNLQRRAAEERQEFGRYQLVSVVLNFLPVLDDLERALDAVDAAGAASDASWVEGVRLVEQKFRGILESASVEEIAAAGQPFDPAVHEAVGAAPGPEGQVVHVLQRGYTLQDRIVRAARVMVGNGEAAGEAAETSQQ